MPNVKRQALINTLSNFLGKGINLFIWFLLTPYILNNLGAEMYGIWILIGSLSAYGSLFDFGITGAVTKYVAELVEKRELNQLNHRIATALNLYAGLGVLVFLVSCLIAPLLVNLFEIPDDFVQTFPWLVMITGFSLAVSLMASITISILRGLHRFDLVNFIGITGTILYTLFLLVTIYSGIGLLGMVAVNIPVTLIMQIPALIFIHRAEPNLKVSFLGANRADIRSVLGFSSSLFIINIAGLLQQKTDELVIGASLPTSMVTPYAIAHRIGELPQLFADQFLKILMPLTSQLGVQGDRKKIKALYIASTRLTLATTLAIGTTASLLAGPLITLWVGQEYQSYSYLVVLLICASIFETAMWPAGSVLQGLAKHKILAYIAIGSGVSNFILSVLLIRPLGLAGVALGTLIPASIECIFIVLPYTWKTLGVDAQETISTIFLPAIIPALPTALVIIIGTYMLPLTSFFSLFLIAGTGLITYCLVYLTFKITVNERKMVVGFVKDTIFTLKPRS